MARKAPKNPISDIVDTVGAWFGGNRGSVPSSGAGAAWQASARSAAQSANRRIVKGVEEGVVQFGALGMGTSVQTQRDLMYGVSGAGTRALKEAAVSQVTGLAAGAVAAKTAQVAGRAVAKAYKTAKATATPSRMVLYHGGPAELKGGIIDPSFVQGNVASGQIKGNTAALNRQQLENVPQRLAQLRQNAKFSEDQLKIPGSYASQNAAQTQRDIEKLRRSAADLENWTNRAKQQNYFTAVGSADETYTHVGSVHVVSPRRKDVQTGLGPGGEYQVVGKQKPVASFPTGGRPGAQSDEAIRLAQAKGAALQKKLQRQAAIKQTAKNLISKRK